MSRFAHQAHPDLALAEVRYIIVPALLWAVPMVVAVFTAVLPAQQGAETAQVQSMPVAEPIGGLAYGA